MKTFSFEKIWLYFSAGISLIMGYLSFRNGDDLVAGVFAVFGIIFIVSAFRRK